MANKTKATPQKEEMWDKGPEIYPAAFLFTVDGIDANQTQGNNCRV